MRLSPTYSVTNFRIVYYKTLTISAVGLLCSICKLLYVQNTYPQAIKDVGDFFFIEKKSKEDV